MKRQLGILALSLPISLTCHSANFYVGAGIGPEMANFNQNAYITRVGDFKVKDHTELSATGVFASLFGGYRWYRDQWFLALELNLNVSTASFDSSNSELIHQNLSDVHYKIQKSVGLSALPGYIYSPLTVFYARLGYTKGNFKISTSDSSLRNLNTDLDGFRVGLGIMQRLSQQLAVRMEFSHINYSSASISTFDAVSLVRKKTNIAPTTAQVEFGLIYEFC